MFWFGIFIILFLCFKYSTFIYWFMISNREYFATYHTVISMLILAIISILITETIIFGTMFVSYFNLYTYSGLMSLW